MSKHTTKYLLIVFTILLFITIGEIIYYFIIVSPQNNISKASNSSANLNDSTPAQQFTNTLGLIISQQQMSAISSILVSEYEGEITELNDKEGLVTSPDYLKNYSYKAIIKMRVERPKPGTMVFYLNEDSLNKLKVVEGGDGNEIELTEINTGDKIRVKETLDMLDTTVNNREEIVITKL